MVTDDLTTHKHVAFSICIYHVCLPAGLFFFFKEPFLLTHIVEINHRGAVESPTESSIVLKP